MRYVDYTNCCVHRVDPPDDEQQGCSKHVEAYYWNKLIENSASCWIMLYWYITMHGQQNIKNDWISMKQCGMIVTGGENQVIGEKPLTATLSTTSSTLLCLGSNPDIRGETPTTCRERHSTAPNSLVRSRHKKWWMVCGLNGKVSVRVCNTPLLNTVLASQTSNYVWCLRAIEGKWSVIVAVEHSVKFCCLRVSSPDDFSWRAHNV